MTAGARHLTLMDRDPRTARRSEHWLRRSTTLADVGEGVEIDLVQGDVAIEADVRRCVANVKKPLKGVFHLAGTLDDCLLADLTAQSIARVFAPKANGALYLHRTTEDLALDHFVMVSSLSSGVRQSGADQLRRRQRLPGRPRRLPPAGEDCRPCPTTWRRSRMRAWPRATSAYCD